jgi:uncharacterized protein YprB with RNaseH-like and TPR domain
MLQSTFVLLKGVSEHTERRWWRQGISDWRTFLAGPSPAGLSAARKRLYNQDIETALGQLELGQARYFARCLKPRDHWRLLDTFRSGAVYLDIETTGEPPDTGEVTVVGLYGGGRLTQLVRGDSLTPSRLADALAPYDLIVTFFGSVFDVPYLRAKFPGLSLDQPHMDLCFAARRLGLQGGLKRIETQLGLERATDVQGLDGWEAVRLWNEWERGKASSLEQLLRYNEADVRNLAPLADMFYERLAAQYRGAERASA